MNVLIKWNPKWRDELRRGYQQENKPSQAGRGYVSYVKKRLERVSALAQRTRLWSIVSNSESVRASASSSVSIPPPRASEYFNNSMKGTINLVEYRTRTPVGLAGEAKQNTTGMLTMRVWWGTRANSSHQQMAIVGVCCWWLLVDPGIPTTLPEYSNTTPNHLPSHSASISPLSPISKAYLDTPILPPNYPLRSQTFLPLRNIFYQTPILH